MSSTIDLAKEREIAARLRNFRETLQIPRTAFAVSVGVGGERLASYETGRVPLRYEVFRVIAKRYKLRAGWLATGDGSPFDLAPFDDSDFEESVRRRELFSAVYDRHLAAPDREKARQAIASLYELKQRFGEVIAILAEAPDTERMNAVRDQVVDECKEVIDRLFDFKGPRKAGRYSRKKKGA